MRTHLIDILKLNSSTQKDLNKFMDEKYQELDIGSTIVLSKEKEFKGIGLKYIIKGPKVKSGFN